MVYSLQSQLLSFYYLQYREETDLDSYIHPNECRIFTKSLLLQTTFRGGRIFASDGQNFVYLNAGKEIETMRVMKENLSPDVDGNHLNGALYIISDFTFSHFWDYSRREIGISLVAKKFQIVSLSSALEIHKKDFYLSNQLNERERENIKRICLKNQIDTKHGKQSLCIDDLMNTVSSESLKPSIQSPFNIQEKPFIRQSKKIETKSELIVIDGWISLPLDFGHVRRGGYFNDLEAYLSKYRIPEALFPAIEVSSPILKNLKKSELSISKKNIQGVLGYCLGKRASSELLGKIDSRKDHRRPKEKTVDEEDEWKIEQVQMNEIKNTAFTRVYPKRNRTKLSTVNK